MAQQDEFPAVPGHEKQVVAVYGRYLNNTGGNDPLDLLQRLNSERNLAVTNLPVFTLAVAVQSQVTLIQRLVAEGRLS